MPVGEGCLVKCTLSTFLLQKCSCPWGAGGSGKVHSEHILATNVLMPVGVSRKVHCKHIFATKVLMLWGGWVSRTVHSEHILATKVLMPVRWGWVSGTVYSEHILATKVLMLWGGGGGVGCPGQCTLSTFLLQKCSCHGGGGLGIRDSALWAHSCYKSAHARGGVGCLGKMHYSGNVPGNEHIIGLPARGMQSIFELPSCLLLISKWRSQQEGNIEYRRRTLHYYNDFDLRGMGMGI